MDIREVLNVKNTILLTIGAWLLFAIFGFAAAVAVLKLNLNYFTSPLACLSIGLLLYFIIQIIIVSKTHKLYSFSGVNLGKIQGSSFIFGTITILMIAPLIYVTIPSVQLLSTPYEVESIMNNIFVMTDFGTRNINDQRIKDLIFNYGIFSFTIPFALVWTFLYSLCAYIYIEKIKDFHYNAYIQSESRKAQRAKKRKENTVDRAYKWDN